MSGRLDLTFSYQGGRDVGRLPVVVDVVGASLEPAVKPRLVQLAKGWRQDLEPGTYLVRVRFPSGEEIRQTCTVRDGDHIPISVDVGGLAGRESLERSVVPRPVEDGEITPWNKWAGTSFSAPQIAHAVWGRRWRGEASREWKQIDFDGITASRDDNAVRYRFASGQQSNVLQLGGRSIAWRFVTLPAAPVVDVTVSPRGENDLAVEVTTDSAEAEALLGYLRTGAVEGADVTAESLLRQKRRDPIAAAIGGYYLLRTASLDRLSAWGRNLSQWFPWLPDGAVINGWQHIHFGRKHRGDPDRHFGAARRQLILAAQRGVPIYTEGLRLLVDGLRLLREDADAEDAELDAALTFIEPFTIAADWLAATVTYSGADPAEPGLRLRYGIPEDRERLVSLRAGSVAHRRLRASEVPDNDSDATLEALYRELGPDLVRYLRRMLQHNGLAEDIAQEAFLILARKWAEVRNHPNPRAWLYTVARNLAIDTLRERSREYLRLEPLAQAAAKEGDPSDSYNIRLTVREAIGKLPARQREVVWLFYFERFKQNEIAAIMQVQRGTVGALLSQARNRLAELAA